MEIIFGVLRVIWLRGLSAAAGAWLSPMLKAAIGVVGAVVLAIAIYALWPSGGNPVQAVLEALGQRETITNANVDEEKRDNAWLEEWEKNTATQRDAADRAAGEHAGTDAKSNAEDPFAGGNPLERCRERIDDLAQIEEILRQLQAGHGRRPCRARDRWRPPPGRGGTRAAAR